MTRQEILDDLKSKNRIPEKFTKNHMNVLLLKFYICRLGEAGFLTTNDLIEPKGFDLCMDLIEYGWVLEDTEIVEICVGVAKKDERDVSMDEVKQLSILIMKIQDVGYRGMLELKEELKEKNDNNA